MARCVIVAFSLVCVLCLADSNDGLATYKAGDYNTAIPLLQAMVSSTPRAALLSALVYQGKLERGF